MNKYLKGALEVIYPARCVLCGAVLPLKRENTQKNRTCLCPPCASDFPGIPAEECPHCGGKTETAGFCEFCCKPYAFSVAFALFPYEKVQKGIHLFKYDGVRSFGEGFGQLMAEYLLEYHEELLAETDLLLSVPLHPKKEKRRGFNQTNLLCQEISKETGLLFSADALTRKRDTVPQSTLTPEERKENLKDVFAVAAEVRGKRILLVDDIFTTGTTCNECAKVLYRAGAKEVKVFCLAAAGLKTD